MRITQRLDFIKLIVILGMFISVLLSHNLWAGQRWFPKAPLFNSITGLTTPYDYINLLILIGLLFFAFMNHHRFYISALIVFCVYLCIEDQNRLQPWFYNYLLVLILLLFYKKRVDEPNNYTTVFISIQLLVTLVYILSGLQKLNTHFVADTFTWMIAPLNDYLSDRQFSNIVKFGNLIPYIEIFIGFGLLIKPIRYIALPLVIIMHILILIFIGPLGNSYNHVVWPWNIMMILLNLVLFANVPQERFFDVSILFKGVSFYLVLTLMLIFPLFSFNNKYDSYLSSSLYSANTHNGRLILSNRAYEKLPYYLRKFVAKNDNYNVLFIKHWALEELNTPCVPEYRIFKKVQERVILLTNTTSDDVILEFIERDKLLDF